MPKASILLVDDEPDILETLQLILEQRGYLVDIVDNGAGAYKMIMDKVYDVVISDLRMPEIDGIMLLKKVREAKNFTKFIFFSAHADEKHAKDMMALGASRLISKAEIMKIPTALETTLLETV
jgi:DNA-binding NtrC family response regulator